MHSKISMNIIIWEVQISEYLDNWSSDKWLPTIHWKWGERRIVEVWRVGRASAKYKYWSPDKWLPTVSMRVSFFFFFISQADYSDITNVLESLDLTKEGNWIIISKVVALLWLVCPYTRETAVPREMWPLTSPLLGRPGDSYHVNDIRREEKRGDGWHWPTIYNTTTLLGSINLIILICKV